ncbi:MAG: hypothetical protein CW335_05325, partial [Clostridiales bacterium]|nr:hypothetical protein [Clostridiales bacterium]
IFSTAATPFCSLFPPLAALANVLSSELFDSLSACRKGFFDTLNQNLRHIAGGFDSDRQNYFMPF